MKFNLRTSLFATFALLLMVGFAMHLTSSTASAAVQIDSLAEFIELQDQSGQDITMAPGTYHFSSESKALFPEGDWPGEITGEWPGLLHFTGSNNTFDLTGVTITFDSTIFNELPNRAHGSLITLAGSDNTWIGFNLEELPGTDGTYGVYTHVSGGIVVGITGSGHHFEDLAVKARFSSPYGFGSIYGKTGSGTGQLPGLRLGKKSALLLHDLTNSTFDGVLVDHSSFGHTLFLSGPINNVEINNASVIAETRSTNDLSNNGISGTDRNGVPFGLNYDGEKLFGDADNDTFFDQFTTSELDRCQSLDSGYQVGPIRDDFEFSLVEGAFRGYNQDDITNLTIRNSDVTGARSGVAMGGAGEGFVVEGMTVVGVAGHGVPSCDGAWNSENGGEGDATAFDAPSFSVISDARADAAYSTVIELSSQSDVTADIEVLDAVDGYNRPEGSTALALISGNNHDLRLWKQDGQALEEDLVIKVGNASTSDLLLCNMTQQSVTLSDQVTDSIIYSIGDVVDSSNGANTIVSVASLADEPAVCRELGNLESQPPTEDAPEEIPEEVPEAQIVHITKRNAPEFAIDGQDGQGKNGETINTQNVHLQDADANNVNQQWVEIDLGNGYFQYQKVGTDYCLDGGRGGENRQTLYLWECGSENQNQQWAKIDVGNGFVQMVKRNATGFAIDGGSGGSSSQNVGIYDSSNDSENLQWAISVIG